MKILWIVNTIFKYPAEKLGIKETCFGGWLTSLANGLIEKEEINLAVVTTYCGRGIKKYFDGKITYYLIPGGETIKYNKKQEGYWKIIVEEFEPQLVHIHGTEYAHGLAFLKACPDIHSIISIQGLVSKCGEVYFGNIDSKDILKNITFRNIIKRDSIFNRKKNFEKRGKIEREIIKRADVILGRTMWDYANTKEINSKETYYLSNETLREGFYKHEWRFQNIQKHTLFCSQAGYPIKGFHYLVKAIHILKKEYNDVKLYVAGPNIIDNSTVIAKLKMSGYGKYIKKLIKRFDVEDNIIFTGLLSEEQMIQKLLKTNVFVLPSVIENSSNSLGEAMLLGMPCVATNSGGTMDILEHKVEGYLYPYTEPALCAEYISRFFKEEELAEKMGQEAKKTATIRHDLQKNVERIIEIYNKIIEGDKK